MKHVFCLGEALIDFTSSGHLPGGGPLFEQNAGGAPANVACALARLGTSAYMCTKVGADMFGSYLKKTLEAEGVNTEGMSEDDGAATTLAFVALDTDGERSFAFVRNPGAETRLRLEDVNLQHLRQAAVLHFGTLSLTHEPARSTLMEVVGLARSLGVTTSIDVNLRLPLWDSREAAYSQLHKILPWCDIVKLSYEELCFALHLINDSEIHSKVFINKLVAELMDKFRHIQLLCVTLGSQGSIAFCRAVSSDVITQVTGSAFEVSVVDTTGAGDAFTAGMLHKILEYTDLHDFTSQSANVTAALQFSNACAALCVTKRGAIAAMPYLRDVEILIETKALRCSN